LAQPEVRRELRRLRAHAELRIAGRAVVDKPRTYQLPARLRLNEWALSGDWTVKNEAVVLNKAEWRHRVSLSRARSSSRHGSGGPRIAGPDFA